MTPRAQKKIPVRTIVAIAALGTICAFGGASRIDVLSQIIVQWVAAATIAYAWIHRGRGEALPRTPLYLVMALAVLLLLQIVPLPPGLWQALPGRALFAEIDAATGLQETWRPISLVPDATLSSLLGLIGPAAALACFSLVPRERWHYLLLALLGLIVGSTILGLLQVGAPNGALYFYRVTNYGSPVGVFANRNHQAILFALAAPLLVAALLGWKSPFASARLFKPALFSIFLLCLVATLVNGSRIGFISFVIGVVGAAAMYASFPADRGPTNKVSEKQARKRTRAKILGGMLITFLCGAVALMSSRSLQTVDRLSETTLSDEGRLKLFKPLFDIAGTYFPVGTGFGSFPEIYKIHEPDDQLTLSYLNHAHNDYLEIAIEGGAFSILLLGTLLIGVARQCGLAWRNWGAPMTRRALYSRLGSIMAAIAAAGSVTDYPLRTPTLGFVFVLGMLWLWSTEQGRPANNAYAKGEQAG